MVDAVNARVYVLCGEVGEEKKRREKSECNNNPSPLRRAITMLVIRAGGRWWQAPREGVLGAGLRWRQTTWWRMASHVKAKVAALLLLCGGRRGDHSALSFSQSS